MTITPVRDRSTVSAQLARMLAGYSSAQTDGDPATRRSMYDTVTGLPNRSTFYTWLATALEEFNPPYQAVSVVFLDLDDFKSLNETFGRQIGDAVLKTVGGRLSKAIRAQDMVSRLGNDEFGCVIVGMPIRDQSSAIASTLLAAVSEPMIIGASEFTVHASIGIATHSPESSDANAMMEQAARAMYRAKHNKSGAVFFQSRTALIPQQGLRDDQQPFKCAPSKAEQ
jgi:diguanylate cyclase (GGDEF)-like protein